MGEIVIEGRNIVRDYRLGGSLFAPARTVHAVKGVSFAAEKGRHMWASPRSIPAKALDYAKYDMVRAMNQVLDITGLRESLLERLFARAIAVPAGRFLRMKRSVNLRIRESDGQGIIADGRYQSPILVQWHRAADRVRTVDATLTSFD